MIFIKIVELHEITSTSPLESIGNEIVKCRRFAALEFCLIGP